MYHCDSYVLVLYFFFNDTATTEIYTLSLHDALPIWHFEAHLPGFFSVDLGLPNAPHVESGGGIEIRHNQIGRAHV